MLDVAYLFKIFGPLLPYLVFSPLAKERTRYLAVTGFALYEREPIEIVITQRNAASIV